MNENNVKMLNAFALDLLEKISQTTKEIDSISKRKEIKISHSDFHSIKLFECPGDAESTFYKLKDKYYKKLQQLLLDYKADLGEYAYLIVEKVVRN